MVVRKIRRPNSRAGSSPAPGTISPFITLVRQDMASPGLFAMSVRVYSARNDATCGDWCLMDTEWRNEWVELVDLNQVSSQSWLHVITTLGPFLLRLIDESPVAIPSHCPDCGIALGKAEIKPQRIECECGRKFRWNEDTSTPECLPIMEVNGTLYAWMPEG